MTRNEMREEFASFAKKMTRRMWLIAGTGVIIVLSYVFVAGVLIHGR